VRRRSYWLSCAFISRLIRSNVINTSTGVWWEGLILNRWRNCSLFFFLRSNSHIQEYVQQKHLLMTHHNEYWIISIAIRVRSFFKVCVKVSLLLLCECRLCVSLPTTTHQAQPGRGRGLAVSLEAYRWIVEFFPCVSKRRTPSTEDLNAAYGVDG